MQYIWTISAKECYKRQKAGLGCKGCYYDTFFSKEPPTRLMNDECPSADCFIVQTCQMKKTIIELIKVIGLPPEE